ncbi:MAG: EAL domain-containing protein [Gammaproteobacteria bacterium]
MDKLKTATNSISKPCSGEQSQLGADALYAVIDDMDDGIFVLDSDMGCWYCNRRIKGWAGLLESEFPGPGEKAPLSKLFGNEESEKMFSQQFQRAMSKGAGYLECSMQPGGDNEAVRWVEIKLNRVELEGQMRVISVARDVTERRRRLQDFEHRATHDPLTGLPTWGLLREQIGELLSEARETAKVLAIFIISLDRFREINNILGPHLGDQILCVFARRLQEGLPMDVVVARHGGHEFSVFMLSSNYEQVDQWGRRISILMQRSFNLGELTDNGQGVDPVDMDIDFTIGIALYPEHGDEVDDLMRKAGVAAQVARSRNSPTAFYDPQFDRRDTDRLLLAGQLRRAIAEDALEVHIQPIVDLKKRTLWGVECQVRWQHPQRGEVSPEQFIPLAEQTGLIRLLDYWVLEQALKICHAWQKTDIQAHVSVNLSARTLDDPQLVLAVTDGMQRWNVGSHGLRVEITESALMANPDQCLERLRGLSKIGVTIVLDDFGTGYSSLAYLKRLPLDCLKIDQSFVKEMKHDESDAVIVRSTIELAHNLGLQVVAEGVEDEETWRMLAALGCDGAQGWHISPAVSQEQFAVWMAESPWYVN